MKELESSNPEMGGYNNAMFRIYGPEIKLTNDLDPCPFDPQVSVPSKVEVLREDGSWQQYPVVSLQSDRKSLSTYIYVIRADGYYHCIHRRHPLTGWQLLQEAEEKGLMKGIRSQVRGIVKEID